MNVFRLFCLALFMVISPLLLRGDAPQVEILTAEADFPESFCSVWEPGDYLVSDGEIAFLVGGKNRVLYSILNYPAADAKGTLIAFGPLGKGRKGDLIAGFPSLRLGGKRVDVRYDTVEILPAPGPGGIRSQAAVRTSEGESLRIRTEYSLEPGSGLLEICSTIQNTGRRPVEDIAYALYFNAQHAYAFSPFHREEHPEWNFRVFPKKGYLLSWINRNPLPGEDDQVPGSLAPSESFSVRYTLLVDEEASRLLRKTYGLLGDSPPDASLYFEDREGDLAEIVIREIRTGTVFFRSFLDRPFSLDIPLPAGLYTVTANFFPAVVDETLVVEPEKKNVCILRDPPKGTLRVRIRNARGEYVPGKVTFIGLHPTISPYFEPANPLETGRRWETFKNSCFPEEGGTEIRLPIGAYLVTASRGPEYSRESRVVEVFQDSREELIFTIDKILDTAGLVSVDPHMHTFFSDGTVSIAERIRSVVAEGVDVAVCTDHNFVNDYRPALEELGLEKYLAAVTGNEVTRGGVIHYNSYPLTRREEEPQYGAIYPARDEVGPLFRDSRAKDPQALIQVNHPRSGSIGYFNNYGLDPETAARAKEDFDLDFDVFEAMNGPYFSASNQQAIADWFHLLNRGHYYPIVGSSDSHTIDGGEPGYSRTYVYYNGDKGKRLETGLLVEAIRKGRSFATNGPLVALTVNTKHIPGDTLSVPDGKVTVNVNVQRVPWVDVDEIKLIFNGKRSIVFPVEEGEDKPTIARAVTIRLEQDTYVAAEVVGGKSLYPVHQGRARRGTAASAVRPYALTNPVFIDVDGNGRFDPPLPPIMRGENPSGLGPLPGKSLKHMEDPE